MDKYLEAIKERICRQCIDADAYGNCRIGSHKVCTIESNIDRIVGSVLATSSDRYNDYVPGLRASVCRYCSYGTPKECAERDNVECSLDRYFPLVIDVIEDLDIPGVRQTYRTL